MLETLLIGIVAVGLGLVVAFAGYPLFRFILPIVGLVFGFMIGTTVLSSWLFGLIIGVILAFMFAVGAYAIWSFMIGFAGAVMGLGVGASVGMSLALPGWLTLIIALALGALFMALAYLLKDVAVMIWTGAAGGAMAAYGAAMLVPTLFGQPGSYGFLYYVVWILVGVLGFIVQLQAFRTANRYGDSLVPGQGQPAL